VMPVDRTVARAALASQEVEEGGAAEQPVAKSETAKNNIIFMLPRYEKAPAPVGKRGFWGCSSTCHQVLAWRLQLSGWVLVQLCISIHRGRRRILQGSANCLFCNSFSKQWVVFKNKIKQSFC
jgi:hypothetical protein